MMVLVGPTQAIMQEEPFVIISFHKIYEFLGLRHCLANKISYSQIFHGCYASYSSNPIYDMLQECPLKVQPTPGP